MEQLTPSLFKSKYKLPKIIKGRTFYDATILQSTIDDSTITNTSFDSVNITNSTMSSSTLDNVDIENSEIEDTVITTSNLRSLTNYFPYITTWTSYFHLNSISFTTGNSYDIVLTAPRNYGADANQTEATFIASLPDYLGRFYWTCPPYTQITGRTRITKTSPRDSSNAFGSFQLSIFYVDYGVSGSSGLIRVGRSIDPNASFPFGLNLKPYGEVTEARMWQEDAAWDTYNLPDSPNSRSFIFIFDVSTINANATLSLTFEMELLTQLRGQPFYANNSIYPTI